MRRIMKAKDWAVQQGYCKAGRGRMPREAHAAIQKAIAGGMSFSDYKGAPAAKGAKTVEIRKDQADAGTVSKGDPELNQYAEAFYRYPMDQKFSYIDPDGKSKIVGARVACMTCGYSLVGHVCDKPVVITYHGPQSVTPKGE
jgi:hypothetical protein